MIPSPQESTPLTATLCLAVVGIAVESLRAEEKLSFNRDVRPILAGNCYDCHGPDEETI